MYDFPPMAISMVASRTPNLSVLHEWGTTPEETCASRNENTLKGSPFLQVQYQYSGVLRAFGMLFKVV